MDPMRKIFLIILACTGMATLLFLDRWQVDVWQKEKTVELDAITHLCKVRLENSIASRLDALNALAALFALHPETNYTDFEHFASLLLLSNPPIRALQYADADSRVTFVYPPKGNEVTIQDPMSLLADPKRAPFVKKAINQKRAVLQGPFELRQGGAGIAVRSPIFNGDRFLGLAIGIYDIPVMVAEAFEGLDLDRFALRLEDNQGNGFWGSDTIPGGFQQRAISIADTTWTMSANWETFPRPPGSPRLLIWLSGLGFLLSILAIVHLSWTQARRLEAIVDQRTQDLFKTNDALKKSEERFNLAMSFTKDGLYDWDLETNVIYYSPGWKKMLGYEDDEVKNEFSEWKRLTNPEDVKSSMAMVQEVLDKKRDRFEAEFRMRHKKGHWVDILSRANVIFDNQGKGVRFVGTHVDITERKKFESEIRKSEEKYRALVENINEVLFSISADGTITYVSPPVVSVLGYAPEALIGYHFKGLIHPEDLEKVLHDFEEALQDRIYENEFRMRTESGELRWVRTSSRPIREHGQLVGLQGVLTDTTDRKKNEEALQTSHRRFLTVLNSIDATIYVADIKTHEILFNNQYMIDSFGRDMVGESCWDVYRGEPGPCAYCKNDQLVDEHGKATGVYAWQDKNPITGRWYINHDRAIEWIDGRLVKIQIATDITELKKMEAELRQAHKMDAIGTLAGGIAHDFNNILSAIIGYTELSLDDVEGGAEIKDNLHQIFKAGKRAKDLVNQILVFSRQSGRELQPIRVDKIAKEVLKLIRSSIPATIDIRHQSESVSLVLGNPTQVHQVLVNLCTNAAYVMEDEGGILDVALEDIRIESAADAAKAGLKPGDYLKIQVSDTGAGIPPEIVKSIFEPYFTTKPIGEGSGMGLAVVHGIVESHNGKITVDSEPGKGSAFTVYLPIVRKVPALHPSETEVLPTGTERILFVDDEEPIARLASRLLEPLGYQVAAHTNSVEALARFRSKPEAFDLVISDMTMPAMTGDKLAVELMKIRPDIPVILCTGYSKKISDGSAKAIGIKAFVYKPIVKADLAKTIRNVIDDAKSAI